MTARIRTRLAARLSSLRGAPARVAAVAGIVTFAVLAGTSSSYAYFQMTQQASAAATSGTLAVTTDNFTSVAYTFRNDQLDTVGSVTVTNTSDAGNPVARTVTTVLSATGDATALANIRYIASVKGSTACAAKNTVVGGALTESTVGTPWSTNATLTASLAPGGSITYCIESYLKTPSTVAVAGGARTITPTVTATLGVQSWTATTSASTTQATSAIYPAFTNMAADWSYIRPASVNGTRYCFDVSGGGDANGTHVISWPCKTTGVANQLWSFVADTGYYSLESQNAQSRRAEQSGTGSGALIYTNTASTATTQDWQLQQVSTGLYQFVNRSSGLCATASNAGGDLSLQPCTDLASTQRFVVSPWISADPTCTIATTGGLFTGYSSTFTLAWTTTNAGPFKVYVGGALVQTVTAKTVKLGPYTSGQNVTITDSSSQYSTGADDTVLATATLTPRTSAVTNNAACTTSNLVD